MVVLVTYKDAGRAWLQVDGTPDSEQAKAKACGFVEAYDKVNSNYKYYPEVVKQGIDWGFNVESGIFLYGNDSSQKASSAKTVGNVRLVHG